VGGGFQATAHPVWLHDRSRCAVKAYQAFTPSREGIFLGYARMKSKNLRAIFLEVPHAAAVAPQPMKIM